MGKYHFLYNLDLMPKLIANIRKEKLLTDTFCFVQFQIKAVFNPTGITEAIKRKTLGRVARVVHVRQPYYK